jgi:hypothetical protein
MSAGLQPFLSSFFASLGQLLTNRAAYQTGSTDNQNHKRFPLDEVGESAQTCHGHASMVLSRIAGRFIL